ncbi:LysE family translocator [Aliivibrio finisterrensis]|uniref:LysE family translocator n=1 Tax=Aliivibrio finisterrensis TaxID=511998 RepID=A0A4Q5KY48_9GAMM|nr:MULTISPECIES: LysE family translocator [Aliivibrio]MDD9177315.1 LysE family translocator [Aliivibrio sp. A6]RYU54799.1 LysE family translocator [Aliivibrio finisterrensis]RYU56473.1 LysE family translocator [Aliivibrio finisterrensis]RYU61594.1 LysE family translocator [Aliivibrio finisterrensis]RYU66817.1 LysE family translocator [Aliivibrio finisterrensis]
MTLTIWFSLFLVSLLGAMSPGPSLATVAKHTLSGKRINGIAAAWAHSIGIGCYAFITVIGLAVVLQQSPMLFKGISYLGAAYLAYLGLGALRSTGGIAARLESGQQVTIIESAKEGLFISLLNPKIALFFLALFSQFVAVGIEPLDKAIIVITPIIVDGLWYTVISCLLSAPKIVDKLRAQAKWIDRLSGLVLILLAVRVVFSA